MNRDPSLAAELADFKRHQAEASRQQREATAQSIQLPSHQELKSDAEQAIEPRPDGAPAKCWYCSGTGAVDGLFGTKKNDCHVCEATGYDLSDPVAVIKLLLAGGRKLRMQFQAHRREMRELRELVGEDTIQRLQEAAWVKKHHSRFD
ncbi:hypothetical protein [Aeromonas hydrophila]|uniref:hypothetical protein n=1 Tax=Aeromonas hydrophila TaxID=644 RepID=UPI00080A9A02|nr:hypothetical protein [Aeromonas hydrophila]ANT70208.1 hypothetical protein TK34_22305 [Aeromonas hydrophila]